MQPPKLAALYKDMEKVRGETLPALSGLTEEEFQRRTGEEWSAGQIREILSRLRGFRPGR